VSSLNKDTPTSKEYHASISQVAFKGATWLGLFKAVSQIISWAVTIIVARILSPADYGLMEMALIIASYAMRFSEMGLGPSIVQRERTSQNELSSVFWFSVGTSSLFAIGCFGLAYFTGWIFNEPQVIPLTKAVAVLFLIQGMQIVPLNILRRNMNFKALGIIEIIAVIFSCGSMVIIANMGGGAWTFISGLIGLGMIQMILSFSASKWRPDKHFSLREVKEYLGFGIFLTLQGSLFYIYDKSDKYFAGRAWNPTMLGYYSFALQLAQIPTEKITVLINSVAFSALSRLQNDREAFSIFYLNTVKITATFVLPLFIGGYLVGGDLIIILFGDKWLPIISLFKYLCLAQISISLNAVNGFVHNSLGRPNVTFAYHLICAIIMPISFYYAVRGGLDTILIPWFTLYVLIAIIFTIFTLRVMGVSLTTYLKCMINATLGTVLMSLAIIYLQQGLHLECISKYLMIQVAIQVIIGATVYTLYMWNFERSMLLAVKNIIK
jgi:O-antigen/teichoic acid export membrane protein